MSEQVQVEITGMVITNRYGSLSSGTILRTDAAFAKHLVEECGAAKHLVEECGAAKYVTATDTTAEAPEPVVKATAKRVKKQESVEQLEPAVASASVQAAAAESTEESAGAEAAQSDTPAE